jgi:hypothetical protein
MLRALILPLALVSTPAFATYFEAQPAAHPAHERFVAGDNVWRCGETGCGSARTATRPAIVCASLAREVGALRGFSVEGRAFDAAALEACNRRAH